MGYVSAPLTSSEVRAFKREVKSVIVDPIGVAEQLDQFLGPSFYSWSEIMSILNILFTGEERGMIRRAAMQEWEKRNPPAQGVVPAEQKFPNVDPQWDNNNPEHRTNMKDLRETIILGIREAAPKSQNLIKAFEIQQGKDETPSAFLQRLRDQMRKYSGMNPDDPVAQGLLKVHFVTKAWPDIQGKLQKMERWSERPLEDLLRYMVGICQKVGGKTEAESKNDGIYCGSSRKTKD